MTRRVFDLLYERYPCYAPARSRRMALSFLTWYTSGELFRDSRPAAGGPRRGEKESGDTPEPPAMGLRPPAPPAALFSALCISRQQIFLSMRAAKPRAFIHRESRYRENQARV